MPHGTIFDPRNKKIKKLIIIIIKKVNHAKLYFDPRKNISLPHSN